jgi:hypothetical protein
VRSSASRLIDVIRALRVRSWETQMNFDPVEAACQAIRHVKKL